MALGGMDRPAMPLQAGSTARDVEHTVGPEPPGSAIATLECLGPWRHSLLGSEEASVGGCTAVPVERPGVLRVDVMGARWQARRRTRRTRRLRACGVAALSRPRTGPCAVSTMS